MHRGDWLNGRVLASGARGSGFDSRVPDLKNMTAEIDKARALFEEYEYSFRKNLENAGDDEPGWQKRAGRAREGEVFVRNHIVEKGDLEEAKRVLTEEFAGLKVRLDENPIDDFGNPIACFEDNKVIGVYVSMPF